MTLYVRSLCNGCGGERGWHVFRAKGEILSGVRNGRAQAEKHREFGALEWEFAERMSDIVGGTCALQGRRRAGEPFELAFLMGNGENLLHIFECLREVAGFDVKHVCDLLWLSGLAGLLERQENTGGQDRGSREAALLAVFRECDVVFLAEIEDSGVEALVRGRDLQGFEDMEEAALLVGQHVPRVIAANLVHGPARIR